MSKPSYEELRKRNQAYLRKVHPEYADDSPTMVKLRQLQAMRDLKLRGEGDTTLYRKLWEQAGQSPITPLTRRQKERLNRE